MADDTPFSVAFPSSDIAPPRPQPQARPTHLPFRRISLPTVPFLLHRESVISVSSFDSLPEDGSAPAPVPSIPAVMRNAARKPRPLSIDGQRRANRKVIIAHGTNEAKRRKIIQEFHETERAYVDGLELIYSHFLTPIIASLETPQPLLDRTGLTSVFSNFIDIWNLHRSFFSSLTAHLFPTPASLPQTDRPFSPILLSHFPYLSLYTPFVTAFPVTISSITNMITPDHPSGQYSASFATWLRSQEDDPRCGKLKLRDWLLTIVQRCPRYLLLLKDLIDCTSADDSEYSQLMAVHTLVSKITLSLNSSLHTHAQTLSLLALQKSTPNLPFQLISPGRTLLKRGRLVQQERSEPHRDREFLLFSDCLTWLASEESEGCWMNISGWANGNGQQDSSSLMRPVMARSRSKSEAELPRVIRAKSASPSKSRSVIPPPRAKGAPNGGIRRHASAANAGEEKWIYKGRVGLVDLEIVVAPPREEGEERRFEVLSPEDSFVLFADTEEEKDEWCSMIRQAKAQLLMALNITNPNSTLTSSASNKHIRVSLQALPFAPEEIKGKTGKGKRKTEKERRGWVEHWVPAIWIPDEKAETCMRCGRGFGWRRRRHHCRLCGRCVCAACSDKTFFISDPTVEDETSKSARACKACYETVFPLLDLPDAEQEADMVASQSGTGTLGTLNSLPFWTSMPSLTNSTPEALMAIDSKRDENGDRVRLRSPPSRPRSYHQLLEDFQDHDHSRFDLTSPVEEEHSTEDSSPVDTMSEASSRRHTVDLTEDHPARREDTARRSKRFSFPAVALQTTSVTTHSGIVGGGKEDGSLLPANGVPSGYVRSKRFSLVLGHKGSHVLGHGHGFGRHHNEVVEGRSATTANELASGAAAGKLNELLGKKQAVPVGC